MLLRLLLPRSIFLWGMSTIATKTFGLLPPDLVITHQTRHRPVTATYFFQTRKDYMGVLVGVDFDQQNDVRSIQRLAYAARGQSWSVLAPNTGTRVPAAPGPDTHRRRNAALDYTTICQVEQSVAQQVRDHIRTNGNTLVIVPPPFLYQDAVLHRLKLDDKQIITTMSFDNAPVEGEYIISTQLPSRVV